MINRNTPKYSQKIMPLNEVAIIDTNTVLPSDYPNIVFNYIALEHIESLTGSLVNFNPTEGKTIRSNKFRFDERHVLLGKLRPYLNKVHIPSFEGICSTDILPLLPKKDLIDRKYLTFCLRSPFFVEYAQVNMQGTKMPRLRTEDLKLFKIPIPPLEEQQRIVSRIEALTKRVEEARKHRQQNKNVLEDIFKSAVEKIINEARKKSVSKSIKSVVEETEIWSPSQAPRESFIYVEISGIDNSLGLIKSTKKLDGKNPPSRARRIIKSGDVIFATTRPYLKNIAVVPSQLDNQICSTGFCVLRPSQNVVTCKWLFYAMRSDYAINQIIPGQEKSAYPAVSNNEVLEAVIPIPSIEEQNKIVFYLEELHSKVKELKYLQTETETELDNFIPALLAKAFRGEL